jgi:hypothetical protein
MFQTTQFQNSTSRTCYKAVLSALLALTALPGFSQSSRDVHTFFRQDIGLTENQVADIRNGKAVVKAMPVRTPNEIFLFGAVYIHAAPESYVTLHHDFDRLRTLPNYLAFGVFSNPPQFSDLKDFEFDRDDIKSLQNCKPGDCLIQMPETSIHHLRESIDWSASNAGQQVNQILQRTALQFLTAYQHNGNSVFGTYHDKRDPTDVAKQFAYLLSYSEALPARLPDFYNYLLSYPNAKPDNVEDTFYWARVKFGLKPTLRIVQLTTMQGKPGDDMLWAMAEKQLYSSHYFETALDLSFCVRGQEDSKQPGFYLIMAMGSEQKGLTGLKGSIVRKAAVGRSLSSLQNALSTIRNVLETNN